MAISLNALDIIKIDQNKINQDEFSIENQKTLDKFQIKINKLGLSKTEFHKYDQNENFSIFNINMTSETIKEPIYILWDRLEDNNFEIINQYQKLINFNIYISNDFKDLFIFTNKNFSRTFINRCKKSDFLDVKPKIFDFNKIRNLTKLENAWGTWEDKNGVIKKQANFGRGIENEPDINLDMVTTMYIDYYFGNDIIQLMLSKEGRIFTNSNLIDEESMIIIFNEIYPILKKN